MGESVSSTVSFSISSGDCCQTKQKIFKVAYLFFSQNSPHTRKVRQNWSVGKGNACQLSKTVGKRCTPRKCHSGWNGESSAQQLSYHCLVTWCASIRTPATPLFSDRRFTRARSRICCRRLTLVALTVFSERSSSISSVPSCRNSGELVEKPQSQSISPALSRSLHQIQPFPSVSRDFVLRN